MNFIKANYGKLTYFYQSIKNNFYTREMQFITELKNERIIKSLEQITISQTDNYKRQC